MTSTQGSSTDATAEAGKIIRSERAEMEVLGDPKPLKNVKACRKLLVEQRWVGSSGDLKVFFNRNPTFILVDKAIGVKLMLQFIGGPEEYLAEPPELDLSPQIKDEVQDLADYGTGYLAVHTYEVYTTVWRFVERKDLRKFMFEELREPGKEVPAPSPKGYIEPVD